MHGLQRLQYMLDMVQGKSRPAQPPVAGGRQQPAAASITMSRIASIHAAEVHEGK